MSDCAAAEGLRSTLHDFGITKCLAIQSFDAGLIGFEGRAVETEASERSLRVSIKKNLCVGVVVRRLAISPSCRSVGPNRKPIKEELGTQFFVEREGDDVDFFAANLNA